MTDKNSDNPIITIIIPTYNRPEMLKVCIKSVLYQTIKNWKMYVIGDYCEYDTQVVVKEFNDPRITYYNNPFRFGEQGGGNSIGIALADTEYLAFLNHDDIWTQNHLEVSINALKNKQANFYIGSSITTGEIDDPIPTFKFRSNTKRKPFWVFTANYQMFEPTSSWVVKTSLAKKITYWNYSIGLYRYPMQDYLIRAWRKKAKFEFGHAITCIRPSNYTKNNISIYEQTDIRLNFFSQLVSDNDGLTKIISDNRINELNYTKNYRVGSNEFRRIVYKIAHDIFVNKITAYLYLYTGIDNYNLLSSLLFLKRGQRAIALLNKRTGEVAPKNIDIKTAVEEAKKLIQRQ